jgi:hypothetical protein
MVGHLLLPLLCLTQPASVAPAPEVQRDGVAAIWFAPLLTARAIAPVAVQVGVQLGPFAMITASYGALPVQNIQVSAWTVGARWFVRTAALSPFVTVESGQLVQEQDDTGGREDRYTFASIGVGLEKVWAHHFSLSTDLQAGPGHRQTGSYHDAAWVFWSQVRLAIGVRF